MPWGAMNYSWVQSCKACGKEYRNQEWFDSDYCSAECEPPATYFETPLNQEPLKDSDILIGFMVAIALLYLFVNGLWR